MKVLIVGGGGLLGAHLAPMLAESGHSVAICDNKVGCLPEDSPATLYTANAIDIDAMRHPFRAFQPEVIFVAPAYSFARNVVYKSYEDMRLVTESTNVVGALLSRQVKQVYFLSSSEVYGGPQVRGNLKESRKIKASATHHGSAKLAAETLLRTRCIELGIGYTCLRIFDMYGPRDTFCSTNGMVSFLIDALLRGDAVGLCGATRNRDFIHAEDVASACKLFVDSPAPGTFNIGSGTGTTLIELVKLLAPILEITHIPMLIPDNNLPTFSSVADMTKTKRALSAWKVTHTLAGDLPSLVTFRRQNIKRF